LTRRIGVIGAGPAGLTVAALLPSSYEVVVFEEHSRIGYPIHCTGIIGSFTADFYRSLVGDRVFENRYVGAYIYTRKGFFTVSSDKPLVYRLNRPLLEEKLYDIVSRKGFDVLLGEKVEKVFFRNNSPCLETRSSNYVFDYVVDGEGFSRRIACDLGCSGVDYVFGIQYLVHIERIDPSYFHVIFTDKTPFLPIWVVPVDYDKALMGYGYKHGSLKYDYLVKIAQKHLRVGIGGFTRVFGGPIPIGRPCYPIRYGRVYLIGDAVPFTKPFSGGGLYGIAFLTPYLVKSIVRGDPTYYHRAFQNGSRRVGMQLLAREFSIRLGGLYVAVEYLRKIHRLGLKITLEDYDRHEKILIRSLPLLITTFPLILSNTQK